PGDIFQRPGCQCVSFSPWQLDKGFFSALQILLIGETICTSPGIARLCPCLETKSNHGALGTTVRIGLSVHNHTLVTDAWLPSVTGAVSIHIFGISVAV